MMHIVHITLASYGNESGVNRKLRQTSTKKLPGTIGHPHVLVSEDTFQKV
jgi:hypothetical protein